jgi:hypothetical protein
VSFFKNNIFFFHWRNVIDSNITRFEIVNKIEDFFIYLFFHIERQRESCWCQIRGVIVKQETKQKRSGMKRNNVSVCFISFRMVLFRFLFYNHAIRATCTCRLKMHLFYYLFLRHTKVWKCDEDCFFIDAAFYIQNSKKTL